MCIFQVHLISTNSNPTGEGATLRRNRDGQHVEVSRPPPVENYHHFMGGVDRNNQLRAKTPVGRPAKKWWKYIFFVINLCISNAFMCTRSPLWGKGRKGTLSSISEWMLQKSWLVNFQGGKGTVVFRSQTRGIDSYESLELNEGVGGAPNSRLEEKQCMDAIVATFIYVKMVVLLIITVIIRCHLRIKNCICIIIGHFSWNFICKGSSLLKIYTSMKLFTRWRWKC